MLVLGGGVGGVVAARSLRKKLPEQHCMVVVDSEGDHLFAPSLLWLMIGRRTAARISRPLDRLRRRGIDVIRGEIDRLEPGTRRVRLAERPSDDEPPSRTPDGVGRELEANHLIVSLGVELTFANGATAGFDLLVYVPPHRAPQVVRDAGLVDDSGRIPVELHTLQTRYPAVYVIGDVTAIPLEMGKPLSKAGVFAERHAEVVAQNIALAVTGRGQPALFNGHGECFIETGGGKAGFGAGDFYADPAPQITLHPPSRRWHVGKLLFEQDWLRPRV